MIIFYWRVQVLFIYSTIPELSGLGQIQKWFYLTQRLLKPESICFCRFNIDPQENKWILIIKLHSNFALLAL